MASTMKDLGIDRLAVEDRLALVQEIWDSIAAESGEPLPTEAQRRELERRLTTDAVSPDNVVGWEEVLAKALARARP
jgi:putative addiction module component (TIGR02574 family)